MWLKRLQVQGLRCFKQSEITFTPGINVLFGDNGAGKTSILEGINVLSCGKSFRTSHLKHIIHQQSQQMTLFGDIHGEKSSTQMGVQFSPTSTLLHVDGEKATKWSQLATHLPVLDIHPESYLLITGGPNERRKFLNWGMFHVEPDYAQLWSTYTRALKQRNQCLRQRQSKQAQYWDQTLVDTGQNIAQKLNDYSCGLAPYVEELCQQFDLSNDIELDYYPGWDNTQKLSDLLEQELSKDDLPVSTQYGPHRADLKLRWNTKPFAPTSSRGQQKVLAIALKIAQAQYLSANENKSSIYLIDELPAELDNQRRTIAFDILKQLDAQIIVSAVSRDSVEYIDSEIQWFHVEQNKVTAVV